ncbi:MAG: O-antigen ligase family protein [Vitreimonas sp.]
MWLPRCECSVLLGHRMTGWERPARAAASTLAVAAFFALLPPAAVGGAMATPVLLCLAGALAFRPSLFRQAVDTWAWPLWLLLAFVAWALATSLWSAQPGHAKALKLTVLIPFGLMFAASAAAEPTRRLTCAAGIAAFIVLAALLSIEVLWDLPLNRAANPEIPPGEVVRNVFRGAAVLLALTWAPAAALLIQGRRIAAGALLVASSLLVALPFDLWAHLAAFVAGLGAFALAFRAPRAAVMGVSGGLAAWMLAAPFLTPAILASQRLVDALPESWAHRAGIWNYVCARILEQPWVGRGLDASRADTRHVIVRGVEISAIPMHPHSASLQIWYETGAIGALLAALALVAAGRALSGVFANNRPAAAAAAATLAALGVVANVSFSAWQEWWIATMFVAAALVGALALRRA